MKTKRSLPAFLLTALLAASAAFAQTAPYTRTVIVPGNGSAAANGAALLAALANLNPAPSYADRWLIKLEPGFFDVGTTPVVMREYVDLEGSGILETHVRGAVGPSLSGSGLVWGLVQGANNSEIRLLTINCNSAAGNGDCQALSLDGVSPRLTRMRIISQGSGTGAHWGIRTWNSGAILEDVQLQVTASNSYDNYGIVYGGQSTLNIRSSNIVARNATNANWAILIKENLNWSPMRDSTVTAIGGSYAAGIFYLDSSTTQNLILDNVNLAAYGASVENAGIGGEWGGMPKIWFRGGRIYGETDGISVPGANVHLFNTEVEAPRFLVDANSAEILTSVLRGGGTVSAVASAVCAGVVAGTTFSAGTCP